MILAFRPAALATLLTCLAAPALASPAVLYTDATVREGPGEQYGPLYQLLAGTHVDLRECTTDEWCRVIRRSKEGWVKLDALDIRPGVDDASDDTAATNGGANGGKKGGGSRKSPVDGGGDDPQFAKADDGDNPRMRFGDALYDTGGRPGNDIATKADSGIGTHGAAAASEVQHQGSGDGGGTSGGGAALQSNNPQLSGGFSLTDSGGGGANGGGNGSGNGGSGGRDSGSDACGRCSH
jgi:hypothetical protein